MIWFLLALGLVAVLGPLAGADSRDGRDWQPVTAFADRFPIRTSGSRARRAAARERAAAHRTAPAAG